MTRTDLVFAARVRLLQAAGLRGRKGFEDVYWLMIREAQDFRLRAARNATTREKRK